MTDFRSLLADLRRPRLLIRAARHGLHDYCRDRDLRRLIEGGAAQTVEAVLSRLVDAEAQIEATRVAGDAGYSIGRHIEILIAMMAEVRLVAR
ncbi:MAG: hypothetical protein KF887_09800 [Paracoccaceae bacterium]|nr:MAG: hypothetical protein KF887_09800 [Paracoccaceae bacterium]